MLYEIIEKFAADPMRRIDAVIVPVRSLHEAAASRVIVELRNIYANAPWMTDLDDPFSNWTATAGGCLLPLEPIDQARLLATGFHQLIEQLVQLDVSIIFLAFPRLVQDPDYLFQKLAPFLPGIGPAQARDLHSSVADATKVRVGDELRSDLRPLGPASPDRVPGLGLLQTAALRRELALCRSSLEVAKTDADAARTMAFAADQAVLAAQDQMAEAKTEAAHLQARITELESMTARLQTEIDDLGGALVAATGDAARERELATAAAAALARSGTACARERARADELAGRFAEQVALLTATHASTSWRLTGPMRGAKVGLCKLRSIRVSRITARQLHRQ